MDDDAHTREDAGPAAGSTSNDDGDDAQSTGSTIEYESSDHGDDSPIAGASDRLAATLNDANAGDRELLGLGLGAENFLVGIHDEPKLQQSVMDQADREMREKIAQVERTRLAKTLKAKMEIRRLIETMQLRLDLPRSKIADREKIMERIEKEEDKLELLRREETDIRRRIEGDTGRGDDGSSSNTGNIPSKNVLQGDTDVSMIDHPAGESVLNRRRRDRLKDETERERLIRMGKITPFSRMAGLERSTAATSQANKKSKKSKSHDGDDDADVQSLSDWDEDAALKENSDEDADSDQEPKGKSMRIQREIQSNDADRYKDDGDEASYQRRLVHWARERRIQRARHLLGDAYDDDAVRELLEQPAKLEMTEPSLVYPDEKYEGGLSVPGEVQRNLFGYQRTCIKWLWELYSQEVGGVVGDEMGLGKTVQIVSFLSALGFSGMLKGPVIVVCPATVLKQWVQEFHRWWPPFRVAILHASGSGVGARVHESDMDTSEEEGYRRGAVDRSVDADDDDYGGLNSDDNDYDNNETGNKRKSKRKRKPAKKPSQAKRRNGQGKSRVSVSDRMRAQVQALLNKIERDGHIVVTTYAAVRLHADAILSTKWAYCVLDEGHKIRNPNSEITLVCKRFKTPHRIVLTGTPIQNNLTELWSLYDFVFPGRLGTLPVFHAQFEIPIRLGGYVNANNVQVQTAYKCACILRDLITPYLLRRMKADVAQDLPKKSEQVLFCRLTAIQRRAYEQFLASRDMQGILSGKMRVLAGIDVLRKICNHPDLLDLRIADRSEEYGAPEKSGKLMVIKALLEMWKRQKHRVLLFSQTRQMLNILETFIVAQKYSYLRMDGATNVQNRAPLIDKFNEDDSVFVFLLTTKVGGLGINLTGANRVLIYDPDWNPSTDMQARERAWRPGQQRDVTIYRLMTSGTIEEKIYHRQIFKQFLTNKILKDPRQRRFFKSNDLHDLFALGGEKDAKTETGDMFESAGVDVGARRGARQRQLQRAPKQSSSTLRARGGEDADLSTIQCLDKVDEYRAPLVPGSSHDPSDGKSPDYDKDDDAAQDNSGVHGNSTANAGTATTAVDNTKRKANGAGDDDQILRALFAKTGVHEALKHDAIMDLSAPEAQIIESEASRVANDAISALRRSRQSVFQKRNGVDTPTWTGRYGDAGAPSLPAGMDRSRTNHSKGIGGGGMSSASLLANLRHRSEGTRSSSNSRLVGGSESRGAAASIDTDSAFYTRSSTSTPTPSSNGHGTELDPQSSEGMILQIRERLLAGNGKATTAELVAFLKLKLSPDSVPIFRKMLKGIADFVRDGDSRWDAGGGGQWRLKSEFY